jgi:hypothetical protein
LVFFFKKSFNFCLRPTEKKERKEEKEKKKGKKEK